MFGMMVCNITFFVVEEERDTTIWWLPIICAYLMAINNDPLLPRM
jgi:hypothetical protein